MGGGGGVAVERTAQEHAHEFNRNEQSTTCIICSSTAKKRLILRFVGNGICDLLLCTVSVPYHAPFPYFVSSATTYYTEQGAHGLTFRGSLGDEHRMSSSQMQTNWKQEGGGP